MECHSTIKNGEIANQGEERDKVGYVYSIGHGNRSLQEFLSILNHFGIKCVVDVRTNPYSRYASHFNKEFLKEALRNQNIEYIFMGDTLGGLPDEKDYYTDGRVDYEKVKEKDFFKEGLEKLIQVIKTREKVVIMCSEINPEKCHRSKLIGEELKERNIEVLHVLKDGKLLTQKEVMKKIMSGLPVRDLFGNKVKILSVKKYNK